MNVRRRSTTASYHLPASRRFLLGESKEITLTEDTFAIGNRQVRLEDASLIDLKTKHSSILLALAYAIATLFMFTQYTPLSAIELFVLFTTTSASLINTISASELYVWATIPTDPETDQRIRYVFWGEPPPALDDLVQRAERNRRRACYPDVEPNVEQVPDPTHQSRRCRTRK